MAKEDTPTPDEYDTVNHNAINSEVHTYCDLQRPQLYTSSEGAYYSEPNAVNPHSDNAGNAFNPPNIDNIHYIVMDNNTAAGRLAGRSGIVNESMGTDFDDSPCYEDPESTMVTNTHVEEQASTKGSGGEKMQEDFVYDLAQTTDIHNADDATKNGSDVTSQPIYELAQQV